MATRCPTKPRSPSLLPWSWGLQAAKLKNKEKIYAEKNIRRIDCMIEAKTNGSKVDLSVPEQTTHSGSLTVWIILLYLFRCAGSGDSISTSSATILSISTTLWMRCSSAGSVPMSSVIFFLHPHLNKMFFGQSHLLCPNPATRWRRIAFAACLCYPDLREEF